MRFSLCINGKRILNGCLTQDSKDVWKNEHSKGYKHNLE